MDTYTIRDLRNRTGDLVRGAESGHLSIVTKHGKPVFIAVPFDDTLLNKCGVQRSLASYRFPEGHSTLVQSAELAGISASEMLDELLCSNINVLDYSEGELEGELQAFKD